MRKGVLRERDIFRDRRRGEDAWLLLMRLFGIAGWLFLFAALAVFDLARPQEYLIDPRLLERLGLPSSLRPYWDLELARYIFYAMVLGLTASVAGLWLNRHRLRRRDDHYRLYLIVLGIISLAGILLYWLKLPA